MRGGNLKIKKAGGGWGGGRSASPPVHSLVDSHVFSCTDGSSVVALSVLSLLFLFLVLLLLALLLLLLLLLLFARSVAVRGGNLKMKEAGGGLGGRAQRRPPSALAGGLTCV